MIYRYSQIFSPLIRTGKWLADHADIGKWFVDIDKWIKETRNLFTDIGYWFSDIGG